MLTSVDLPGAVRADDRRRSAQARTSMLTSSIATSAPNRLVTCSNAKLMAPSSQRISQAGPKLRGTSPLGRAG